MLVNTDLCIIYAYVFYPPKHHHKDYHGAQKKKNRFTNQILVMRNVLNICPPRKDLQFKNSVHGIIMFDESKKFKNTTSLFKLDNN